MAALLPPAPAGPAPGGSWEARCRPPKEAPWLLSSLPACGENGQSDLVKDVPIRSARAFWKQTQGQDEVVEKRFARHKKQELEPRVVDQSKEENTNRKLEWASGTEGITWSPGLGMPLSCTSEGVKSMSDKRRKFLKALLPQGKVVSRFVKEATMLQSSWKTNCYMDSTRWHQYLNQRRPMQSLPHDSVADLMKTSDELQPPASKAAEPRWRAGFLRKKKAVNDEVNVWAHRTAAHIVADAAALQASAGVAATSPGGRKASSPMPRRGAAREDAARSPPKRRGAWS
eukprot:TRINITY_DN92034_c0_g1_i1.p1 TRINITY_DN92034_c0_g1~~TRINITY_DN92034_c0_g1_i1.p1  ORF type:complete len:294 (+),score=66.57 TRINITY_DN92034_c0_g1_i1:26-883(+)